MDCQNSIVFQARMVQRAAFPREQMDGDRIARKRVDHQHVEPRARVSYEAEASVAFDDLEGARGRTEIREGRMRQPNYVGIDLVELPIVTRAGVAGEGAG